MQSVRQYRQIGQRITDSRWFKPAGNLNNSQPEQISSDSNNVEREISLLNVEHLSFVEWESPEDPLNPRNWSQARRAFIFCLIWINCFAVDWPAGADSQAGSKIANEFHVSEEAESLSPALYTFGIGVSGSFMALFEFMTTGALLAGPISETVGRNPIYIVSRLFNVAWLLGSALAPNFGAQCVLRFLAGTGGSILLAIHAASIADLYNPIERTLAWPTVAMASFLGTVISPIVGGWIAQSTTITWRWTEWISLIISGSTFVLTLLFLPETFSPILLQWKAVQLRRLTGNPNLVAQLERQPTFRSRLKTALLRAAHMFTKEPIVILLGAWLVLIYIVVYGFVQGLSFIFGDTYNFKRGLIGSSFAAIGVGVLLWWTSVPVYWWFYRRKVLRMEREHGDSLDVKHVPGIDLPEPEYRLWTSVPVAPALPISLFWLGWTNYASISPWSNLGAMVLFGISWAGIYVTVYQYILDVYGIYAGSALAIITFFRYTASGAINLISRPMYNGIGVHWTMTLLGCIAVLLAPAPLLFAWKGPSIRMKSRFASKYARPANERRRTGRAASWT